MNNRKKIMAALGQVLDYELKAINYLKSVPKEENNSGNKMLYTEIKKRMAEELKEAELMTKQVVLIKFMKIRKISEQEKRNNKKGNAG